MTGVGETDPVGYFGAERRVSQQSSAERRREDGRQMGGVKEREEKSAEWSYPRSSEALSATGVM